MSRTGVKHPLLMVCCLLALGLSGCAQGSWFRRAKPDALPGVPSPAERIAKFRKLAQEAKSADESKKQATAQELCQEIRNEQDPMIRAEIIRTLGYYQSPSGDGVMRAAMTDPEAEVRIAACEAWGKRGDAQAATLLGGLLAGDVDKDVRFAAARALGQSRDPAAIKALGGALEDSDPAMQHRAVASLGTVTGQNLGNDVNRWRQYVKSGAAKPAEPTSVAGRLPRLF